MESPVRYARIGDVHIAYRVFGDGPYDILLVPGTLSHVELYWELPVNEYILKRLTSFARVIVFDKRGQGLSDRVAEQSLEERIGDVRAVLDAAGSKRATVFGWSEGGPMSLFFAATYPERTSALVMFGTFASMRAEPYCLSQERFDRFMAAVEAHWGEGMLVPSMRRACAMIKPSSSRLAGSSAPHRVPGVSKRCFEPTTRMMPAICCPRSGCRP